MADRLISSEVSRRTCGAAMNPDPTQSNRRILIIDDNPSIHADFKKILGADATANGLDAAEADLFGQTKSVGHRSFQITTALQGKEGLEAVKESVKTGRRFALAFVDVRMPPGWDGIETTAHLWEADPDLQIVICTAYSDYTWDDIVVRLKAPDQLVILKKPFDVAEVLQLASAMTSKWTLTQQARSHLVNLEGAIRARTEELQLSNEQLQAEVREREATEQALRATQEMLKHFLAKSPAAIYSLRFENRHLVPNWISENCTNFLGGEVADWYRQTGQLEYVDPADRESVRMGTEALETLGQISLHYRVRRKDGEVRWIKDDRQLVRNSSGEAVEIVGCWTDVTEHRLLEEQLRQAQKMESVGQLAGGVAHDFNNLLTVIQGYVELLLNTEQLLPSVVEPLRQVHMAADKAGTLTRQLLVFSRKQVMRPAEVDINDLILGMMKLLSRTLGENITVQTERNAALPLIYADRGMVEQVLMNLAVNSRDAMPNGGTLTISASAHEFDDSAQLKQPLARAGRFVCIHVADSGTGIAPENLSRIFEPFFTTKEVGKGTGLGLATVYGIVKQHEGWVEVESTVGKGTTFHIYLPSTNGHTHTEASSEKKKEARGSGETVLVVEDEAALRRLVCTVLRNRGYRVHAAGSGLEALNNWSRRLGEIDLLLTDVVMPDGVAGWELARELRSKKPALKVIYMSGYSTDLASQKEAGSLDIPFLQKPFGPDKLAELVRQTLQAASEVPV